MIASTGTMSGSRGASAFNTPTPTQVPPRLPDTEERIAALEAALEERILVLDGATGTALQAVDLTAADFGGPELEGCNEMLCATRPDVVAGVHERYLAPAPTSSRPTPSAPPRSSSPSTTSPTAPSSSTSARRASPARPAPGSTRRVGCASSAARWARPPRRSRSPAASPSRSCASTYGEQARGLMAGGADYLLLETCQDTRNIKAGLLGIARRVRGRGLEPAGRGVGDDRDHRHHARRPGRRGAGGVAPAPGPALRRAQLRHRARAHERPPAHAVGDLRARASPACPTPASPTRRATTTKGPSSSARCSAASSTPAGSTWSAAAAAPPAITWRRSRDLVGGRAAAPVTASTSGRWCPGSRRSSSPSTTARCWWARRPTSSAAASSSDLIKAGDFEAAAEIGRAQVALRRADPRRLPAGPRPRRDRRRRGLPRPHHAPGEGAADDRLHRRRGDGAGAHLVSGQVGPQLDQPRGRPPPLREGGAAGAPLRRRAGGRADRREGDGGHGRAQARGGQAQLQDPHRGHGCPRRGHLVGRAGLPLRHRRRELHRLGRRRPSRRCAQLKAGDAGDAHHPRRLERQLRSADRRPRGAQLGLPLPRHPGRARRRHRQHRAAGALRRDPGGGAASSPRRLLYLRAHRRRRLDGGDRGLHRSTSAAARRRRSARPRARLPARRAARPRPWSRARKEGLDDDLELALADRALAGSRSTSSTAR